MTTDTYFLKNPMGSSSLPVRTMGMVGHHLDQKRLKAALYRHPWDDLAYMLDW